MYEVFEKLLAERNVTAYKVAKETGIATATLSDWKNGKSTPKINKLQKIADYLGVPVGYFLNDGDQKENPPALTKKDERDISLRIDQILSDLESQQTGLMFDGEPLDDETKELLAASLRSSMETSKVWARKKFTPKKYRKDE